jgi:hypothetical protein
MVKTIKNLLNTAEIQELLAYHNTNDDRTDDRPGDVRSKHPRWNIDTWPQHIVQKCLDHVLDSEYEVEEVLFLDSITKFGLHVDTADGGDDIYKTVIIPILVDGDGHTVFFDNYWHGPSVKFHADTRHTQKNTNSPIGKDLYRQQGQPVDRCKIKNYQAHKKFDLDIYQNYLTQMHIDDLHGLTVSDIITWQTGDTIVFDRFQLHSASCQHNRKVAVTVFTRKKHANN